MKFFTAATMRNIVTLILGPLLMVPTVWMVLFISTVATGEKVFQGAMLGLFIGIVGLVFAYPATLLVGIPAFVILERCNRLSLLNISLVSGICAVIIAQVFPASILNTLLCIYSALSVSTGCWLVNRWVYQRQLLKRTL